MVPLTLYHNFEGSPMCAIQKFSTLMAPSTVWYIKWFHGTANAREAFHHTDSKILGLLDKDKGFNLRY